MNITVVICTYNRCFTLARALDSVAAQLLPDSVSWEVVVVDNNSCDQTREVVEDYGRRFPGRFRYVFEPHQGLSRARNAGIHAARGEIIAFTDDDVIADSNWLRNLTASLFDGKCAGAGGRIVPPPDFTPPDWYAMDGTMDLPGAFLPLFDLGNETCEMKKAPYGANMAFHKSMFEKHGMFRVDLGRFGDNLLMGEDTNFGNLLISAGEVLRYEPSALVQHPVPQERLSKKHFRAWWFDFGRTRIIERGVRRALFGIPGEYISILSVLLRSLPIRLCRWLFTVEPRLRFSNECQVRLALGEIVQHYRKAHLPKPVLRQNQR